MQQWNRTSTYLALLIFMLTVGILTNAESAAQPRSVSVPPRLIRFTCAIAVNHQIGELCISAPGAAYTQISVDYCDGSVGSPVLTERDSSTQEYRWIWNVQTSCIGPHAGVARAMAWWPDHTTAYTSTPLTIEEGSGITF